MPQKAYMAPVQKKSKNKGVTQRAFDAYNKKNGLPLKDVKDIITQEATEFYKKEYWEASGVDKIKDKNLAYMHYDTAINHGVGTAKKNLRAIRRRF